MAIRVKHKGFHCGVASPRDHLQEVAWAFVWSAKASTVVLLALEITSRRLHGHSCEAQSFTEVLFFLFI